MRNVLLFLLALCMGSSATAQTVVNPESNLDPNRILVFLPDKDIPPPYEVEGNIDKRGLSEIIRISINGHQVIPDISRPLPAPDNVPTPSSFEIMSRGAGDFQVRMSEEGRSHKEIFDAVVQYFKANPEVVEVNPIDGVSMEIVLRDGTRKEYWASPGVVSTEKGMQTIIDGIEFKLEHGYALLFSSANTLYIKPRDYDLFIEELAIARSADPSTLTSRKWKVLTPKVVVAIGEDRSGGQR